MNPGSYVREIAEPKRIGRVTVPHSSYKGTVYANDVWVQSFYYGGIVRYEPNEIERCDPMGNAFKKLNK